jgi:DNA polymerase-1
LQQGEPLSDEEVRILETLEREVGHQFRFCFAVEAETYQGVQAHDIPSAAVRAERSLLRTRVMDLAPDFILCMGDLATKAVCLANTKATSPYDTRFRLHTSWDYPGLEIWTTFGLDEIVAEPTLLRWVVADVRRAAAADVADVPPPPFAILRPNSSPPVGLETIRRISFDTETYPGLDPLAKGARVRMGVFAWSTSQVWVLPPPFPQWALDLLADPRVEVVGSNIKFDQRWVYFHHGIRITNMRDTHTAAHVLDETRPQKGLKPLALELTPYGDYSAPIERLVALRGGQWSALRDEEMVEYAGYDGVVGWAVYHELEKQLKAEGLAPAYDLESRIYNTLGNIELTGMAVDPKVNKRLITDYEVALGNLSAKLRETFGPINFGSTQQLADALERTVPGIDLAHPKSKKRSTEGKVLKREHARLGAAAPVLDTLVQWKKLDKTKGTFLDPVEGLARKVTPDLWFIHPQFNTDRVRTYRLSSSNPNAQNIPKDWPEASKHLNVKHQFVSRFKGGRIVSADQSQIELRILACLAGDRRMIQQFLDGGDIHAQTAAAVFACRLEDVTPFQRSAAKTVNFLVVYGGGADKLALVLGIRKQAAAKIIKDWFRVYSGIRDYIEEQKYSIMDSLEVRIPFGLRRRFANVDWDSPVGWSTLRKGVNAPVQGGAVFFTLIPMVSVEQQFKVQGMRSVLINQVHDEILADTPPDETVAAGLVMKEEMERVRPEYDQGSFFSLQVPLICNVKAGPSWGSLETLEVPSCSDRV